MKTKEQVIQEFTEAKLKQVCNGFNAVIVQTNGSYGLQYWSDFLINQGHSRNSDGTLAKFVCLASA